MKFWSLHIIGEPAKSGIAPTCIDGIASRVAQTAKTRHVVIHETIRLQAAWKILSTKLRISSRTGNGSDIHQLTDAVRAQDTDELIDRMRGVPDRKHHVGQASR